MAGLAVLKVRHIEPELRTGLEEGLAERRIVLEGGLMVLLRIVLKEGLVVLHIVREEDPLAAQSPADHRSLVEGDTVIV